MKRHKTVSFKQADLRTTDHSPSSSFRQRFGVAAFVGLCMMGAALISWFLLIHNSIRLDEAQSLWQTSHSLAGTLKVVAQDVHVPLYHVILHYWQIMIGSDIVSARLLSMLFFLATIPLVYLLARRILSIRWSLLVVFLFSFSPFMNWYANEARMYTLLVFVATLSQYFFLKLVESNGKRGWLGYGLSAMVGIYAHYFFMFNLAAQGMYYLLNRKRFAPKTFWKFLTLAIILIIEFAPWAVYFYSLGSASNTSPNLPRPTTVDLSNVFSQFAFGFQNNALNTILVSIWPLLVIVALLAVRQGQRLTPKVGYTLVAAFVPILLAFGLSHIISPFFLGRYMISCLAPLLILLVWFMSHYKRSLALFVSGILVLALTSISVQQYTSRTIPVREDYQAAAELISREAQYQDIVVLSAPFTVYPFNYYYTGRAQVATLPIWNRSVQGAIPGFDASNLPTQANQLKKDHQYAYLLLSYDQGYEDQIYQYWEQNFERIKSQEFSPELRLIVYRTGYSQHKALDDL